MFKLLIFVQLSVLCAIISSANANSFWDSLVNVDRSDDGNKKVGVHLPFIYWMDLNRNKEGPKLALSVLGGLVKVNVDRSKEAGKRPVMVRLLGQKIYNSYPNGYDPSSAQLAQANYGGQDAESVAVKPLNDNKPSETVDAQESVVTEQSIKAYDVPPSAAGLPASA